MIKQTLSFLVASGLLLSGFSPAQAQWNANRRIPTQYTRNVARPTYNTSTATNAYAQTRMTPRQAIYYHASKGNTQNLYKLKQMGYQIDLADAKGNSALCEAVWRQDRTAVSALISVGANQGAGCMQQIPANYKTAMGINSASGYSSYYGTKTATATATSSGLSTGAMVGIGVGAAALIGGGIALAAGGGGGGSSSNNTIKEVVCNNHGTKQEDGTCSCATGYTGENCESCDAGYDKYGTNTCHATLNCHNGSQQGDTCQCNTGWKGTYCDTANTCTSSNTSVTGCDAYTTCTTPTGNFYTCTTCKSGYSKDGDGCKANVCSSTNTSKTGCTSYDSCTSPSGTFYTCKGCSSGYTLTNGVCVANTCTSTNTSKTGCTEYDTCTTPTGNFYTCSACADTYTLTDGVCIATSCSSTNTSKTGCKNYESCTSSAGVFYTCSECNSGYTLSHGACVENTPSGQTSTIYFKGLRHNTNSLTIDENVTIDGLYEGNLPMISAHGILNSDTYANVTVSSSSTLTNTSENGDLVFLEHANLTNNGNLKGNISMNNQGKISNTNTGKIEGDIILDGELSNVGEIKGNIDITTDDFDTEDNIFENTEDAKITGSVSITNNANEIFQAENAGNILFSDISKDKITLKGTGNINFVNTNTGHIQNSIEVSKGTLTNNGEIKLDQESMTLEISNGGQVTNNSSGTISSEKGNVVVNGGILENKGNFTLPIPSNFQIIENLLPFNKIYSSGTINNSGDLQGLIFSSGSISNTKTINGFISAGGTSEGDEYMPAGTYPAGTLYNSGTINGISVPVSDLWLGVSYAITMDGNGTFTNDTTGIINGFTTFSNTSTEKLNVNNNGTINGGLDFIGNTKNAISVTNKGEINGAMLQVGGTFVNQGTINDIVVLGDRNEGDGIYSTETIFINEGLINVDATNSPLVDSTLTTSLGTYNIQPAVFLLAGDKNRPVKFYNSGTVRLSNVDVVRQIMTDGKGGTEEIIDGGVIQAVGPGAYVYNEGTIEIKNSTLTTEDYTQTPSTITSTEELNGTGIGDYFINLSSGASMMTSGTISTGLSSLDTTAFSPDGTGKVVALPKAKFTSLKSVTGNIYMSNNFITDNFKDTVVAKDMIQTPDASGLKLISESALFDAKLADNGSDVVMKMKNFTDVVPNKSLAQFLSNNYALANNADFYNKLKSFDNLSSLNNSLNQLTGKDVLSRFNFEDMSMMRELNYDMNNNLFHSKENHLSMAGSVSPMAFKGDTGSNSRYSLFSQKHDNTSIGLGIAFTDTRSDDDHESNNRHETMYQMIVPFGYKAGGFNMITSPRIGYARGEYDRTGFDGENYDGTLEKRVYGVMNEARYPFKVAGWSFEPSLEFNILGYQQKGSEDGRQFSLHVPNQQTLSVEGGMGFYATKETELSHGKVNLSAGLALYHEFADPYKLKLGMEGMDGSFEVRDENRSDNRAVARAGFNYTNDDNLEIYGSILSYIDKEARTKANTGMKWKF